MCTAIYFAEIANDDIRGRLSTSYALSRNFGILLSYVLGIYMNYIHASMICLVIAVLFAVSFTFMPATPQHLLRRGAIDVSSYYVYFNGLFFLVPFFLSGRQKHFTMLASFHE